MTISPGFPSRCAACTACPPTPTTAGRAEITAPRGPLAWLICRVSGLPRPGSDVPVTVAFSIDGKGGEYWRRRFAGRRYASALPPAHGRHAGMLVERFFPFLFYHRLTRAPTGLRWTGRLAAARHPAAALADADDAICFESGDGDRFVFDIDVVFPLDRAGHPLSRLAVAAGRERS